MKIKIIKRASLAEVAEKIAEKVPAAENRRPVAIDVRKTAATIEFWIDDLRQKRARERRSAEEFFKPRRGL